MQFFQVFAIATLFVASYVSAASSISDQLTSLKGVCVDNKDAADKCIEELSKEKVFKALEAIKTSDLEVHKAAIVSLKALAENGKFIKALEATKPIPNSFTVAATAVTNLDPDANAKAVADAVIPFLKEYQTIRAGDDSTKFEYLVELYGKCIEIMGKAITDAKSLPDTDKETLKNLSASCNFGSWTFYIVAGGIVVLLIVVGVAVFFIMRRK